jgi:hypothetical protein
MDMDNDHRFLGLPLAHQKFSVNVFNVFCSHPGWARPGALVGVFAVSAVLHDLGMWGLGWEKKQSPALRADSFFSWAFVLPWSMDTKR